MVQLLPASLFTPVHNSEHRSSALVKPSESVPLTHPPPNSTMSTQLLPNIVMSTPCLPHTSATLNDAMSTQLLPDIVMSTPHLLSNSATPHPPPNSAMLTTCPPPNSVPSTPIYVMATREILPSIILPLNQLPRLMSSTNSFQPVLVHLPVTLPSLGCQSSGKSVTASNISSQKCSWNESLPLEEKIFDSFTTV